MRRHSGFLFVIAVVLLISTAAKCDQQQQQDAPIPTYVSRLERFVRTLMAPFEILDNTVQNIGKGVKDVLPWFPRAKKNLENGDQKPSKSLSDILNPFKDRIKAIYPGTRWCGDGDIAESKDDLGLFKRTDACCRAHDGCPSGIPAGEQRFGLLNNGIFTRSHCDCDEEFYRCLKEAHSIIATKIGMTYFNVLRPQCFREDYTVVNCKKYSGNRLIDDKCDEYNFDQNAPKKVQWFDSPDFYNI